MFLDLISAFVAGLITVYLPAEPTSMERIQSRGALSVAVRLHPNSYYTSAVETTVGGFDYELVHQLADSLGVRVSAKIAQSASHAKEMLRDNRTDLAATGLHVIDESLPALRYAPVHGSSRSVVVYRQGSRRPRGPEDLVGRRLVVPAGTAHAVALGRLKAGHPKLAWTERDDGALKLLRGVFDGDHDLTVADSHEFSDIRRVYPELRPGFEFAGENRLAWGFPRDADDSLFFETLVFLNRMRSSGRLDSLRDFYYRQPNRFDYVDARQFLSHVEVRLPRYERMFKKTASMHGLDWRLIAAVGYQESHWNPEAVSPTGVRGLMMLTQVTAEHLGVDDRLDPGQSIRGGARYLRTLLDKIPDRIGEPDRTWLALAAYNIGYGHLEDARVLTQANGGDPDRWDDVRQFLLLKEKKKWYKKTRRGFARGSEAVYYVEKVRRYYETLISLDVMAKL